MSFAIVHLIAGSCSSSIGESGSVAAFDAGVPVAVRVPNMPCFHQDTKEAERRRRGSRKRAKLKAEGTFPLKQEPFSDSSS